MSNAITTTITVQFQGVTASSQADLKAEIDNRKDGLNNGVTSFSPGDSVGYLVFSSPNVSYSQYPTSGSISSAGGGPIAKDEFLTFANQATANTGYPIASIQSVQWYGSSLGEVVQDGYSGLKLKQVPQGDYVGIARVKYLTNYDGYKLQGVPLDIDQAVILIVGKYGD